jgi:hypothetical protein
MPGLLDDIGSVLTNPTVEALLPAVIGAAGAGLSSPRRAGTRGAIGNALSGGATGLAEGMRTAAESQNQQQELALKKQEVQANIAQHQLLMKQTTDAMAAQDKSLPTVRNLLKTAAGSPLGKQFFGPLDPDAIDNLDYNTATHLFDKYSTAADSYFKTQGKTVPLHISTVGDNVVAIDRDPSTGQPRQTILGPKPKPNTADYSFGTDDSGHIVTENRRTGAVTPTTTKAAPKGTASGTPTRALTPTELTKEVVGQYQNKVKDYQTARKAYDKSVTPDMDAATKLAIAGPEPVAPPPLDKWLKTPEGIGTVNGIRGVGGATSAPAATTAAPTAAPAPASKPKALTTAPPKSATPVANAPPAYDSKGKKFQKYSDGNWYPAGGPSGAAASGGL